MKHFPVWLLALGAAFGCRNSQPASVAPASTQEQHEPAPTVPAGVAGSGSTLPKLSNCVLHAGSVNVKARQEKGPDGTLGTAVQDARCTSNAECIAQQGQRTAGDGFVYLTCTNGDCSCRIEPDTPPAAPVEFHFQASCTTSAQAKQLLLDHCLAGMGVIPARP
jgi:hypothetical protein